MSEQLDLSEPTKIDKKEKKKGKAINEVDLLLNRVHNLEQLILRMAHMNGTSHKLIKDAGLEPYAPTAKDMSKFHKVG